jgi:hypothetical protein
MCPHAGQATLMTSNSNASAVGAKILLESDVHTVAGCPFMVGQKPSPCVRIEWSSGANKASVNGTTILTKSSIGECLNGEGAAQGVATIVNTQLKASAQ